MHYKGWPQSYLSLEVPAREEETHCCIRGREGAGGEMIKKGPDFMWQSRITGTGAKCTGITSNIHDNVISLFLLTVFILECETH